MPSDVNGNRRTFGASIPQGPLLIPTARWLHGLLLLLLFLLGRRLF